MMLYSWKDRAEYARYQASSTLDDIETTAGTRLPDEIRGAVLEYGEAIIRRTILDVAEETGVRG